MDDHSHVKVHHQTRRNAMDDKTFCHEKILLEDTSLTSVSASHTKNVKDEMEKTMGCHESGQVGVDFRKSAEHEKLREYLAEAAKLQASDSDFCTQLDSQGSLQMEQIGQGDHKSRLKASLGSISYRIQPSEDLKRSSSINWTNSDE